MPLTLSVEIRGLDVPLEKLRDPGFIRGPWRTAVTKSTYAIHDAAFQRTPRVTGHLQRSLTTAVDPSPLPAWGRVGTNLSYAPLVHFGTRPHVIEPVNRRALSWRGARHPVRRVRHPGTRPQPFLREGLRAALPVIVKLLRDCGREIASQWRH